MGLRSIMTDLKRPCVCPQSLHLSLCPRKDRVLNGLTFLLKFHFLFSWPSQTVQGMGHLATKLIFTGDMVGSPGWVLLLFIVIVIQYGGFPDRHTNDWVVCLKSGGAEALPGLRTQQHWWDVVNLMSGFCACTLLWDAPALLPTTLGIQCHCEHQQQEEQCNKSTLEEK